MTGWRELATNRLALRMPRPSDAGPIALFCQDIRVANMTTSIPHPYLPDMAEAFVAQILAGNHREEVWAMDASRDAGEEFVGIISYQAATRSVGYWVGPPFWSTGYASEALQAVTSHLIIDRGLSEVKASVFFDNPASQQVLRKAGYQEDGSTWLHSIARGQEVPAKCFVCRSL